MKRKRLFYGTSNEYKIQNMKDRLRNLDIELISPKDLRIEINVDETGKTVMENAILKAKAYYNICKIPTIAGDSAMFVEKFDNQPGLYVRRVNGVYLSDEELEKYYINELEKVGGSSNAYYVTALALVMNNENIKSTEITEDPFLLTSKISTMSKIDDALGRLEFDTKSEKYFCEMSEEDKIKRNYKFDEECVEFIKQSLHL